MNPDAINITVTVLLVAVQNALYLVMRKRAGQQALYCVLSVVVYITLLSFMLLSGRTLSQTALAVTATLPCAFIPLKGGEK